MTDDARIEAVDDLDCPLETYDWPFARENAAAIAERWRAEIAGKPKMFDGRVLLARQPAIAERDGKRVFTCAFFETSFSAFTAARAWDFPDKGVFNVFAMAALRAADGAFLLGEMGPGTASAGQIYFPAGTPDRDDIVDSHVDLDGSVLRELEEETGLAGSSVAVEPGLTIVVHGQMIACMRVIQLAENAEDARRRIESELAAQAHPELVRMHIVRKADDIAAARMPAFMPHYLRYALG
jgi:8-oxo-dGTP pyrophosphatase MutT (NUDIX family)